MMLWVGVTALFALLLLGVPIGFAMILVGALGFAFTTGFGPALSMTAQVSIDTGLTYGFSVLPMFLLMGNVIARSRLAEELYAAANALLGNLRGGLAHATILACGCFSAFCGSTVATAATMTRIAVPSMRARGYHDSLSSASVAAGGTLGSLIPPSVAMIIYGLLTETDIALLFLAGFIPGVLGVLGYMAAVAWVTQRRPDRAPPGPDMTWRERRRSLTGVWAVVLLVVIVLGGIYGGIFTATEAAGIGAAGAILLAFARRSLSLREFLEVVLDTGRTTAMLFFVLIGALVLTNFLNIAGLPGLLADIVGGSDLTPLAVLAIVLAIYLLLGCFLDTMAMMMLTIPIVFPLVAAQGIDPIWFGILVIVAMEVGLISPPFGMNIFVVRATAPGLDTATIFRGIAPFIAADLVRLCILVAFPVLTLALPHLAR